MNRAGGRRLEAVSPLWLVVGGIVSVQVGAAVAKGLFAPSSPTAASPTTIVWLRLTTTAVLVGAVVRPRVRGRTRHDWVVVAGFALGLGLMNWSIYQSLARIPLGTAVTIEFLGPLAVTVAVSRRRRDLLWAALAAAGVAALGLDPGEVTLAGVGFALVAACGWATYILLGPRLGRTWPGGEGLAVASTLAALVLAPFAIAADPGSLVTPRVVGLGIGVGILSSVIPYSLELSALQRMPRSVFSVLMSLEPAVAALVAMVILGELLAPIQWLATAAVVIASVGATRSGGSSGW
ncbi:MAG: EamA family transporter [Acidimicrobiales bacterium]